VITPISHWKIRTKLLTGFVLIGLTLLAVGGIGLQAFNTLSTKTTQIIRNAPLVDAAMEMKVIVSDDIQTMLRMLGSENSQEPEQAWLAHEESVRRFDLFASAALEGKETDEGRIHRARGEALRNSRIQAERFHDEQLQPVRRRV
jgi:hypothetical protein